MTSRILWVLLRHYFGCGLRHLRLRGLLLSARGGAFLSESWLRTLSTKCPRLRKLYLQHADLRGLPSCKLLPSSIKVLELHGCELPRDFFVQSPSSLPQASSSAGAQQQQNKGKDPVAGHSSGIGIERLVLKTVPSFTDQHLQSLTSWEGLRELVLCDTFRVTAYGLRSSAAKEGASGMEGLSRLKSLELSITRRQGYQLQMASLGLGAGWPGLVELILGGKEVGPGLVCASRLTDLKHLWLTSCTLSETQLVRGCRMLRGLRRLEFLDVVFESRQRATAAESEDGEAGEEDENNERAEGGDAMVENNEQAEGGDRTVEDNDPVPNLRRSLTDLMPSCTLVFSKCSVQISTD